MRGIVRMVMLCTSLITSAGLYAQDSSSKSQKYVGFDANTMLSQVVPFSNFQQGVGFPAVLVRRLWDGHGYRTGIGFGLDADNVFLENAYISFGYARLKDLGEKYSYTTGLEIRLVSSVGSGADFVGLANYWGFEYRLNNVISISTEASLQLGVLDDFQISVRPPVRIQCHFRLK